MRCVWVAWFFVGLAGCQVASPVGEAFREELVVVPLPPRAEVAAGALLPCAQLPCAERPIVFVHGFTGSNDDWTVLLDGLSSADARYDGYHRSGNLEHHAWADRSIDRRRWLFAFDYYVLRDADGRGSYTAGPGRIGSDNARRCASPAGTGALVGLGRDYDDGVYHEYAADLAAFVDSVRRATGSDQVDLVAHSMGGLIARSYLTYYGGARRVQRLLLLASPVEGIAAAGLANYFSTGFPGWMQTHEVAELDASGLARRVDFRRCQEGPEGEKVFGRLLLEDERALATSTQRFVLSGARDFFINHGVADHPLALSHEVVGGADHGGVLRAPLTLERVSGLLAH